MSEQGSDRRARSAGRELALAVLCHLDVGPRQERMGRWPEVLDQDPPRGDGPGEAVFAQMVEDPAIRAFAESLIRGVEGHLDAIDEAIGQSSRRWSLERMDLVDRNVLRLATGEFMSADAPPAGVLLSEAVRLAKKYGSERSARFVNGVLDTVLASVGGSSSAGGKTP